MKVKTEIKIGGLRLKNPVTVASGTFGYAAEFSDFMDLRCLGAVTTKTITLSPRCGNPAPRTCETPAGMLNSIGLENPGLKVFLKEKLPFLKRLGIPLIVSIASEADIGEFVTIAEQLEDYPAVSAIELNISCPNIQKGRAAGKSLGLISQDARATHGLVNAVRKAVKKTIITKLSPNVSDISEIALAAEAAGSDALALINTLSGLSIDVSSRRPKLASLAGGLSGPAVRPVAVKMVWDVSRCVGIPIIGMGGITDAASALEFILAGATAVSIGTANFIKPSASAEVILGIRDYLRRSRIDDINKLRGGLQIVG